MKKEILTILLLLFVTTVVSSAQENNKELKISLEEAQEYAIKHNKMVIAAKLDVEASEFSIWETISNGLPQVDISGSFTDNLKLATTLLPGELAGMPGEKIPVTFGSQFNSNATIQASMLLFSAPLYLGIKTSKLARSLSEESLSKSELDTKEAVSSAYYLILISEKSMEILKANIANLKETLTSTRAMYDAGMAESTDVDQIVTNVTMVENSLSSMERTIELNYNLLRFQMGLPQDTRIELTETLESLTSAIDIEAIMSQQFNHKEHVDYLLVDGQEQISLLNLKSQQASVLPTLSGFYNYGTSGMGDKISEQRWFQSSMTGLQLSVPILASGQRYARIRQARINLEKAKTNKEIVTDQLVLQEKQLRYNLVNANLQYKSQKENIEVAKRVYASTENKFKQGMASSLDLTQANSIYLQAEDNYISALMNLLDTKLALDKLLNNM